MDFKVISENIDQEHEQLSKRVAELKAQLAEAAAQLQRLSAARAALQGKVILSDKRTRNVSSEGKRLRKAKQYLSRARKVGDRAKVKELEGEVKRLQAAYDAHLSTA